MATPRRPWTDAERDRIRELHAEGRTLHSIAKELGRSKEGVSRHAKAMGLSWDRSQTAKAAEANHVDNKARRATIETTLLEKVVGLLTEIDGPEEVYGFGGADYVFNSRQLDHMTPRSKKDLMQAVSSALVAANRLHELNSEGRDLPAVDAWLNHILGDQP
ncbi:helix-turn-helix domain-containing protein [Gordonia sp. N1V]|uniref:helix-turn-helix domain-containing protein n=1 Tax=Gordonia sp. N1V TaxID=3034163 RepID=UPI0023E15511|nr:helix-turn-helix domain-containing protein [Gordonia sp. N1V]MDF3280473.1 helix-turn-helix domain-containing protein [Gordonia sp. N1V]